MLELRFVTAMSGLPSLLKSAMATPRGFVPTLAAAPAKAIVETGEATRKDCGFDNPPAGAGLLTVICPAPAVARSEARREALSCVVLTKVVVRLAPFHSTEAPLPNPAPLIVRLVAAAPGAAAVGTKG